MTFVPVVVDPGGVVVAVAALYVGRLRLVQASAAAQVAPVVFDVVGFVDVVVFVVEPYLT